MNPTVRELAFAKVNLVLHVGRPRRDGLHPVCSVFASLALADELEVAVADRDAIDCPGVPDPNLAAAALAAFRSHVPGLPPCEVRITKRIPVAAGLGGGSADAAATLRAANRMAGEPLSVGALREIAAGLGSDVPSQVEPRNALVQGVGEVVEPMALPPFGVVLVAQPTGMATADVYAELDRAQGWRERLDPGPLRDFARAEQLENDLQPAALALRPELAGVLGALGDAGAPGTLVSGSGPTCFGLFAGREQAERAARALPGAIVTEVRRP